MKRLLTAPRPACRVRRPRRVRREARGDQGASRHQQHLTLMLDWFPERRPRGHLPGAGQGVLLPGRAGRARSGAGQRGQPAPAASPPGRSTWRSPTSRSCCWPATRTCRWSRSAAHRPAAADLDHLDRQARRPPGRTAAGQDGRRRRDLLPARLPGDDPGTTPTSPPARSRRSTSAPTSCRRCVSGRVDAILGGYWNYEAVQLAQLGKHPNVIRMNQVGVPTYDELVLVTATSMLEQHPDVLRRFVQAMARGYESARATRPARWPTSCALTPGSTRSSSWPA